MQLECPSEWHPGERISLTQTVTYESVANEENPKPITLHTEPLRNGPYDGREGLRIYRLRHGNWERHHPGIEEIEAWGAASMEDPVSVEVGRARSEFTTLRSGETWSEQRVVQSPGDYTYIPDDAQDGDYFKFLIKGAVVDWWDLGTMEDHRNTVVKLHFYLIGDVVEPSDNNGRPKLIVPVSNEAMFTYVTKGTGTRVSD
jgi:hypothetical protein